RTSRSSPDRSSRRSCRGRLTGRGDARRPAGFCPAVHGPVALVLRDRTGVGEGGSAASAAAEAGDPEDRVAGGDGEQLLVGGVGAEAVEERADLPLPAAQVGTQ